MRADDAGADRELGDGIVAAIHWQSGRPPIEGREFVRFASKDRYAECFQHLHRARQIEDRLGPADTTAIGICDSAVRSAETSPLSEASRCTPPIPPVANTRIPLACAANIVAATVVEPG